MNQVSQTEGNGGEQVISENKQNKGSRHFPILQFNQLCARLCLGSPPRQRKNVSRLTHTREGKSAFNSEEKLEEKKGAIKGGLKMKSRNVIRLSAQRLTRRENERRKWRKRWKGRQRWKVGDWEVKTEIPLVEIEQLSAAVVHNLHQTEYACEEEDLETVLVENCCCRSIRDR